MYKVGDTVSVNDQMQQNYSYLIIANLGENFSQDFQPFYTPQEMLKMGIFEGKYCNDCRLKFPESWFLKAKISDKPDPLINYFGVKSR